jgi:iron complex transport system substrate-binding protein
LATDFAPYTGFKAYKEKHVWGCNTARTPFYEETPFHPEFLLEDMIRIFHPELNLEGGKKYYEALE